MFIEDLSAYQYRLPFPLEGVRCVGWLDSEHRHETGRPPDWLTEKLESIVLRRDSAFDAHVNVVRKPSAESRRSCNLLRLPFNWSHGDLG